MLIPFTTVDIELIPIRSTMCSPATSHTSLPATVLLHFENHRKSCPLVASLTWACIPLHEEKTVKSQQWCNLLPNGVHPECVSGFGVTFKGVNNVPRDRHFVHHLQGCANPSWLLLFPRAAGLWNLLNTALNSACDIREIFVAVFVRDGLNLKIWDCQRTNMVAWLADTLKMAVVRTVNH